LHRTAIGYKSGLRHSEYRRRVTGNSTTYQTAAKRNRDAAF